MALPTDTHEPQAKSVKHQDVKVEGRVYGMSTGAWEVREIDGAVCVYSAGKLTLRMNPENARWMGQDLIQTAGRIELDG